MRNPEKAKKNYIFLLRKVLFLNRRISYNKHIKQERRRYGMKKKERVRAVMENQIPDKIPAGFWFHYSSDYTVEEMAEAHLNLYRQTDADLIKIMQDYSYPIEGEIHCAEDWYKVQMKGTESEAFQKLTEVIRLVKKEIKEEAMVFQTMFGPFKAASIAFGDEVLMKYSREAPEAVAKGIRRIACEMEKWAQGYLDAGADGIYYSAQFGEEGRFTKEQWEQLVKPYDLQILKVADQQENKYNILHICGEPEYRFKTHVDWYQEYPADLVNWSVKDNEYSLEKGRKTFQRPVLGGMNNKGNILNGPEEAIEKEVQQILDSFGTRGIMIGADCTIQGENIRLDYIKKAVETAHQYKG